MKIQCCTYQVNKASKLRVGVAINEGELVISKGGKIYTKLHACDLKDDFSINFTPIINDLEIKLNYENRKLKDETISD